MTEYADNYDDLSPDLVIQAVESQGFLSDLRMFPLNSYENRVYSVGIEDAQPLIVKFYRPHRWSNEAIREEHEFSWELVDRDLPIVPPIRNEAGETLFFHAGYRFALFARRGGQSPEAGDLDQIYRLGRLIARIHAVGATRPFEHRRSLSVESYGVQPSQYILKNDFLNKELAHHYEEIVKVLLERIESIWREIDPVMIRAHGDCHLSNILWHRDLGPAFVDMDDCLMAPAIQDLWMLIAGERSQMSLQISEVLAGYTEFFDFNGAELRMIEPLRSLRMIHYAGWLARRWDDPAFPKSFPWFNTEAYWQQHIHSLRQQIPLLDEEPLRWL